MRTHLGWNSHTRINFISDDHPCQVLINPWHTFAGTHSVRVSVCLLPQNLLPTRFLHWKQGTIGSFVVFSRFYCLAFTENASFKSYGIICWSPPPSLLPGKLLINKRDSHGFFWTQIVCSHNSNKTTSSSLILAHIVKQTGFLALCVCQTCWHGMHALIWHMWYCSMLLIT